MAQFIEIDLIPTVGNPNTNEIRKIYTVIEPVVGGGGLVVADDFLTDGSGNGSCPNCLAAIATTVDVFLNEPGEQGIKIQSAGYSYDAGTGVITSVDDGLEANKNYTAYAR